MTEDFTDLMSRWETRGIPFSNQSKLERQAGQIAAEELEQVMLTNGVQFSDAAVNELLSEIDELLESDSDADEFLIALQCALQLNQHITCDDLSDDWMLLERSDV